MHGQKPFIIFLNGVSSSGKTSIARALGYLLPAPTLLFGIDNFLDLIPPGKMPEFFLFETEDDQDSRPITRITSKPHGKTLCRSLAQTAKVLADSGFTLIINEVLLGTNKFAHYLEQLADHRVYFIGVHCDLATLEEREAVRGDRALGMAREQIQHVHNPTRCYDFEVDTTHTVPFDCARQILEFVERTPEPTGFARCKEMLSASETA